MSPLRTKGGMRLSGQALAGSYCRVILADACTCACNKQPWGAIAARLRRARWGTDTQGEALHQRLNASAYGGRVESTTARGASFHVALTQEEWLPGPNNAVDDFRHDERIRCVPQGRINKLTFRAPKPEPQIR